MNLMSRKNIVRKKILSITFRSWRRREKEKKRASYENNNGMISGADLGICRWWAENVVPIFCPFKCLTPLPFHPRKVLVTFFV